MELTEWYPCTVNPVRDGWYEVQRMYSNRPLCAVERMKFEHGRWCWLGSEHRMPVWVSHDVWRGVQGEVK